jgi:hypothetical protein
VSTVAAKNSQEITLKKTATMVAANDISKSTDAESSKAQQLWEIIHNGRQFLQALEQYAAVSFPINEEEEEDEEEGSATLQNQVGDERQHPGKAPENGTSVTAATTSPAEASEVSHTVLGPPKASSELYRVDLDVAAAAAAPKDRSNNTIPPSATAAKNHQSDETTIAPSRKRQRVDAASYDCGIPVGGRSPTIEPAGDKNYYKNGIVKFCAQTGRRLGRFENPHAAATASAQENPGVQAGSVSNSIRRVLHGDRPKYKKFFFRYEHDTTTPMPSFPIQRKRHASSMSIKMAASEYNNDKAPTQKRTLTRPPPTRPIIAYNKSGTSEMVIRGRYPTLSAAASALSAEWPGVDIDLIERGIDRAILGDDETEYLGYIFRYADERDGNTDTHYFRPDKAVIQLCAQTGRRLGRYRSAFAAANAVVQAKPGGKVRSVSTAIGRVLHGETPKWKNLYFRYELDTTTPMPSFPIQRKSYTSSTNTRTAPENYMNNNDKPPASNGTKETATTTTTTIPSVPTGSNDDDPTKNAPKLSGTNNASTDSVPGHASDQEASRSEGDPELTSADTMAPESPGEDSSMERDFANT